MTMDPSTEIRNIPISKIMELIQILDFGESWKKLMTVIPKKLENEEEFVPKYGVREMDIIENAGRQRGSCTQILFDEWGTSGSKRPTIKHLLSLLIKCDHYRAADFVAVKLLNGMPVKRPNAGPAAPIDTSFDRLRERQSLAQVESIMNGMPYPNMDSNLIESTFNRNLDNKPLKAMEERKFMPQILSNLPNDHFYHQRPSKTESTHLLTSGITNKSIGAEIPAFSQLLPNKNDNGVIDSASFTTSIDSNMLRSSSDYSNNNIEAMNKHVPYAYNLSEPNIPNLSIIRNENSEADMPNLSLFQANSQESSNIPDFNALQSARSYNNSSMSAESDNNYSSNDTSNIPNITGLQYAYSNNISASSNRNIVVNTVVPHFPFKVLQEATNNFQSEQIFSSHNHNLIGGKIGDGGFGTVYLSRSLLKTPVAIKKLSFDYAVSEDKDIVLLKEFFKVEIEILTKCDHENILTLLGYSYDGANLCLVSEYMENGSLNDNIATNKLLTPDLRLEVAKGTAKGIDYLHNAFENPLIHRDIKSANILLTCQYVPKICDFGLVKCKYSNNTVQTTKVIGTTAYMSPEAFRGDVSVKMDVFSFGVVLLELLTSLAPMDEKRNGKDILTHVEDICTDGPIEPLLDRSIGEWTCAERLYEISKECLEEKRKRPVIKVVYDKLCAL